MLFAKEILKCHEFDFLVKRKFSQAEGLGGITSKKTLRTVVWAIFI